MTSLLESESSRSISANPRARNYLISTALAAFSSLTKTHGCAGCGEFDSSSPPVSADNCDYGSPLRTQEIDMPAPTAMNRQVGPSILLSVLIVCFFAVALYQPDAPRSSGGRARYASGDSVARSGPRRTGARPRARPIGQNGCSPYQLGARSSRSRPRWAPLLRSPTRNHCLLGPHARVAWAQTGREDR